MQYGFYCQPYWCSWLQQLPYTQCKGIRFRFIPLSRRHVPSIYYMALLYQLCCICLLIELRSKVDWVFAELHLGGGKIGQNTIWIYFWHIPFVNIVNEYIGIWEIRYMVLLCLSISCFSIQYTIVQICHNRFLKRFLVG